MVALENLAPSENSVQPPPSLPSYIFQPPFWQGLNSM